MSQATVARKERPKRLPLTGAQYLEGLRDGREIWLNGERVNDVTTHPAFRNGARSVARLYDALRPFLDQYYKGANMDAEQRVKLSKLIWDAIGSEFGGRHELYERNYARNVENLKVETFFSAQADGDRATLERLVQTCLDDYDLNGWTVPTWVGPEQ